MINFKINKIKHYRKQNKKEKNIISLKNYLALLFKIFLFLIIFFLFFKHKPLIIILVFEIFDFFKTIIKLGFPFIPIDFVFVFGITAAYYYGFIYSIIIFALGILNRIIMTSLQYRHISKAIRHFPLFIIASIIKIEFFYVAVGLLILNYVLKYGFKIAQSDLELEKLHFNIVNFFLATLAFYLISVIYFYFPFLK